MSDLPDDPRLIPDGTVLSEGTVVGRTLTALIVEDEHSDHSFVPFTKLRRPRFVEPLVRFR